MTTLDAPAADGDLVLAYSRHGDAEAFAELVRRYAGLVYATALRVTQSDADAQDVSQECFLTLAAEARRGRWSVKSVPGWLHALARSRATDALRRASARRRHELHTPALVQRPSMGEWERIQPHIDAAIAELPDELRILVTRHYLCGVSQGELASTTGLSQPTVSRRLAEAVEQLRQSLGHSGVSLSVAVLADQLASHGLSPVPASLTAALGKMAIAGFGATAMGTAAKLAVAAVLVAALAATWQIVGRANSQPAVTGKGASMVSTPARDLELPRTFAIRIVNIPPLKMVRSGRSDLKEFDKWWSAISAQDKYSITPRDYMWGSPDTGKEEWVYALPPGVSATGGYDALDFPGGLYAVTSCREDDVGQAYDYALDWVRRSGLFALDDGGPDRYSMVHVITPQVVRQRTGINQMDLFIPVAVKPAAPPAQADLLKSSFAIRLVQIPPLRMVRSGSADPEGFKNWMSSIDSKDKYSTTPRAFIWHNSATNKEEWVYALPQGVDDTGGYQTLDFRGGLYAVTCCRESELGEAGKYVRDWVRQSGKFGLDEAGIDRYSMCYIVNPQQVGQALGFSQMDFFIPITFQWPATTALPTPDPAIYEGMWFPRNEPTPAVLGAWRTSSVKIWGSPGSNRSSAWR
jgi:RNA polymerase sigma factor (sigma-70 family)